MDLDLATLDKARLRQALATGATSGEPLAPSRFQPMALDGTPVDRACGPPPGVEAVPAAVVALLYPGRNGVVLPLTERPADLAQHSGQVSLPGGRIEASDRSPLEAALRETREELGIDTHGLEIWAELEPLYLESSNHQVYPFLAWSDEPPVFRPDPREVTEVFEFPLAALLDERYRGEEAREFMAGPRLVPFFHFSGHKVWGATARILEQLAWRLSRAVETINAEP